MTDHSSKTAPQGRRFLALRLEKLLSSWSFWGFRGWLFFRLVFAQLVSVLSLGVLLSWGFVPVWKLDAFASQDTSDARRWLSAILEIKLNFFFIKDHLFSLWVIVADLSHNTTRERVALGFLDDYPVHRKMCAAITLHANREHFYSLIYYFVNYSKDFMKKQ
jgi:hypothetical protein